VDQAHGTTLSDTTSLHSCTFPAAFSLAFYPDPVITFTSIQCV